VLCLQLKRFDLLHQRLDYSFSYPQYLDMAPYLTHAAPTPTSTLTSSFTREDMKSVPSPYTYRLSAVIDHSGLHYTAFTRSHPSTLLSSEYNNTDDSNNKKKTKEAIQQRSQQKISCQRFLLLHHTFCIFPSTITTVISQTCNLNMELFQ